MKEKSKNVTARSKVFGSATKGKGKGKLGTLTFGDISNIVQLLDKYKGPIPEGYSRRHCHACFQKKP